MRAKKLLFSVSATLVVLCTLSACASGTKEDAVSMEDSPLAPYAAALWGNGGQAYLDEQAAQVEELIAQCMKSEGFEYTPEPGNGSQLNSYDPANQADENWVSQNGYGITSAVTIPDPAEPAESTPNELYVSSLGDAEQGAYFATLYGSDPELATGSDDYAYDWEAAGCRGSSEHTVAASSEVILDRPEFAGILDRLNELNVNAAQEPEARALETEWANCMADAGYADIKGKSDAALSIVTALDELQQGGAEAFTASSVNELHKQEVALALADLQCATSLDYMQRISEVQFALEKQFVADNKVQLDQMLAALAMGD